MINILSPLEFPKSLLRAKLEKMLECARAQEVQDLVLAQGKTLALWRLDQVCPVASGNKFFKQALYWQAAEAYPNMPVLSFGGAYSNHLYALAAEARRRERRLIAVVRGLHEGELNPCLSDIANMGSDIHFVSRQDYRRKEEAAYLQTLAQQWGPFVHVPEGGGGLMGAFGAQAIGLAAAESPVDTIVLAVGTGSTAAGVLAGLDLACRRLIRMGGEPLLKRVLLVPVLNLECRPGQKSVFEDIQALRLQMASINTELWELDAEIETDKWITWECCDGFQFGGYGKFPLSLTQFLSSFEERFSVRLDPVYTAKAMAFACQLLAGGEFPELDEDLIPNPIPSSYESEQVLFIHSGGLQGRRGFGLL
ncbi:hypothetical protein [Pseudoteredinibacter isoporae]|uniref:hypothetical protein n=1 Tax=Pseudoteredinibacter isoporae TaxID=570281 RepID=UPI00310A0CE9